MSPVRRSCLHPRKTLHPTNLRYLNQPFRFLPNPSPHSSLNSHGPDCLDHPAPIPSRLPHLLAVHAWPGRPPATSPLPIGTPLRFPAPVHAAAASRLPNRRASPLPAPLALPSMRHPFIQCRLPKALAVRPPRPSLLDRKRHRRLTSSTPLPHIFAPPLPQIFAPSIQCCLEETM